VAQGKARKLPNLGAGANLTQVAQAACGKDSATDPGCADVLLLALTPASYSSNNTADTFGQRAFISPAQVQLLAVTATEAVCCVSRSYFAVCCQHVE
jgi:hypothetical protein